jgi:hypothetical protein
MQMEEGQKISDVFSNPMLPKEMELFFERMSKYLDEGDRDKFFQYVQTKHAEAVNAVEEDLARVNKDMNVDQNLSETSPSQGYITSMTKDLGESPDGAPLFIFNMVSKTLALSNLPGERVRNLIDKKYLNREENIPTFSDAVSFSESNGKIRTERLTFGVVAKVISGDEEKEVILRDTPFAGQEGLTKLTVGDKFKFKKDSGFDMLSEKLEQSRGFKTYIEEGLLEYNPESGYYTVKSESSGNPYSFEVKLLLAYKDIGKGRSAERALFSINAPEAVKYKKELEKDSNHSKSEIKSSENLSAEETIYAEEGCDEYSKECDKSEEY